MLPALALAILMAQESNAEDVTTPFRPQITENGQTWTLDNTDTLNTGTTPIVITGDPDSGYYWGDIRITNSGDITVTANNGGSGTSASPYTGAFMHIRDVRGNVDIGYNADGTANPLTGTYTGTGNNDFGMFIGDVDGNVRINTAANMTTRIETINLTASGSVDIVASGNISAGRWGIGASGRAKYADGSAGYGNVSIRFDDGYITSNNVGTGPNGNRALGASIGANHVGDANTWVGENAVVENGIATSYIYDSGGAISTSNNGTGNVNVENHGALNGTNTAGIRVSNVANGDVNIINTSEVTGSVGIIAGSRGEYQYNATTMYWDNGSTLVANGAFGISGTTTITNSGKITGTGSTVSRASFGGVAYAIYMYHTNGVILNLEAGSEIIGNVYLGTGNRLLSIADTTQTIDGDLWLDGANATFAVTLNGTGAGDYGTLEVNKLYIGGARLELEIGATANLQTGDMFDIITASSVDGTLSTGDTWTVIAGGTTYLFDVAYTSGITLTLTGISAVPEPATWAAFTGLALLVFAAVRRRRRKIR
jgi:hypothetical protein